MALAMALVASGVCGCDRFDPPPAAAPPSAAERAAEQARKQARAAMTAVMKAAQAATASCVAGELRWEADVQDLEGTTLPHHYSRPCLPERCAPGPAEIEALRTSTRAARALVDGEPSLHVPSYQGFVRLSEAMVAFAETAMASSAPAEEKPLRMSGLSMHYGAVAAAFREVVADSDVPLEPPSLVKSLEVPAPGGDPCKGWALRRYCDVRGVRVPKERKWRTNPPCIEVEGIRKGEDGKP